MSDNFNLIYNSLMHTFMISVFDLQNLICKF